MDYLIDTHSHIYYDQYSNDLDEVINRAVDNGINKIICIGVDLQSSIQSLEIANTYENVFCSVGYHPHESAEAKNGYLNDLENMCADSKVVAIGETGLDYHYNHSNPDIQKKRFIEQIELANNLKLPLIIHNRESDNDLYEILKKYTPTGVIHCFSSNVEFANKIIDLGLLLSFTGIITFKNSALSEVIESIPITKLMVETDSPYLTPEPYRGKRNEPAYVSIIAKKISEIKKIPLQDVINQTTSNALTLFSKLK